MPSLALTFDITARAGGAILRFWLPSHAMNQVQTCSGVFPGGYFVNSNRFRAPAVSHTLYVAISRSRPKVTTSLEPTKTAQYTIYSCGSISMSRTSPGTIKSLRSGPYLRGSCPQIVYIYHVISSKKVRRSTNPIDTTLGNASTTKLIYSSKSASRISFP